ncbi:MAG: serine hydrolase [Bdellovibrionaceae bacterium]|nr:serine hydrolase [Pseudobdellovibrionaceae bacterium]
MVTAARVFAFLLRFGLLPSLTFAAFVFSSSLAPAQTRSQPRAEDNTSDPLQTAQYLCRQLQPWPNLDYERHFTDEFRREVPEPLLVDLFRSIAMDTGPCERAVVEPVSAPGDKLIVRAETRGGNTVRFEVTLAKDQLWRISGFFVREVEFPKVIVRDYYDLQIQLKRLPGDASVTIAPFGRPTTHIEGDRRHPIGSIFKLYVLGALERAIRSLKARWFELLPIREESRSLPSGVMQTWPVGKRVTLFEYAKNMIALSDNTATDHIIHRLSRAQVEAELSLMGNSFVEDNRPFLMTNEFFKIKHALRSEQQSRYLSLRPEERRTWLETQAKRIPLSSVRYSAQPVLVDDVEWFASTNDLCKALYELDRRRSREVREILSTRTPGVSVGVGSKWRYAGYKGGSEPGVSAHAYLLESQRGDRVCVALAWHNPLVRVSDWRSADLVRKTIQMVERSF